MRGCNGRPPGLPLRCKTFSFTLEFAYGKRPREIEVLIGDYNLRLFGVFPTGKQSTTIPPGLLGVLATPKHPRGFEVFIP